MHVYYVVFSVFYSNIKWHFFLKNIRPMPKNFAQMAKFHPIWSPWLRADVGLESEVSQQRADEVSFLLMLTHDRELQRQTCQILQHNKQPRFLK
jgi:hypothetical protein